jgi:hypothetical protein
VQLAISLDLVTLLLLLVDVLRPGTQVQLVSCYGGLLLVVVLEMQQMVTLQPVHTMLTLGNRLLMELLPLTAYGTRFRSIIMK